MTSTAPAELQSILPFLSRAQELKNREPIVSYYCSFYAVKLAIANGKSKESQAYISELLDTLEHEKSLLQDNEAIQNESIGYAHIQSFALRIFLNADNEDRSGNASKKTAKTFLAASIFLELLKVFGDMDPDNLEKIKYAKFKAADIIKSIKEGRAVNPGPPQQPGGNEDETVEQENQKEPETQVEELHENLQELKVESSESRENLSKELPKEEDEAKDEFKLDYKLISLAQKHAKWAISSLNYDDINSALTNLQQAIEILNSLKPTNSNI